MFPQETEYRGRYVDALDVAVRFADVVRSILRSLALKKDPSPQETGQSSSCWSWVMATSGCCVEYYSTDPTSAKNVLSASAPPPHLSS